MDRIDHEILQCLLQNARVNATAISNTVHLSTSTVIERIKRMEAEGVIKQYTIILDSSILGADVVAYMSVRLDHPKYNESFQKKVCQNLQITECYYIAGDVDYLLKIATTNTKSLADLLTYIKGIEGVAGTKTQLVLSTVKSGPILLPNHSE